MKNVWIQGLNVSAICLHNTSIPTEKLDKIGKLNLWQSEWLEHEHHLNVWIDTAVMILSFLERQE